MNIINIFKLKFKAYRSSEEDIPDWSKERLKICQDCPLNSKHTQIKEKNFRWFKWWFLNLGKDFCTDCTCQISAKVLAEIESCPQGKWESVI